MESVAEDSPLTRASNETSAASAGTSFMGVLVCFILSGFAAMIYQTAWLRQFSVVFGTSELAVATVLAAYMAGLALGAALAGKFVGRVKRPVLTYGLLELGIAVGALLVPIGLTLARSLQAMLIGGQAEISGSGGLAQPIFYLVASFAVIMIPTTLMGATLPLLTRHVVRRDSEIGSRVGMLYTMNTAGAVLGTLVAAFMLLPAFGLSTTIYFGVAVNGVVFLIASRLAGGAQPLDQASDEPVEAPAVDSAAKWILPLILISGVTSFTYEVLWTRLLGQILGGSVYAFATMLATFLVGITIGSAVASYFARNRTSSVRGFLFSQVGIALLSIFVWSQLDGLPDQFNEMLLEGGDNQKAGAIIAGLVLLPSALCIGATFPFALRVLATSSAVASQASARVYSWNTVGAIVGAVLAGFYLLPSFGLAGAARLAVCTNLLLAFATGVLLLRSKVFSVVLLGLLLATGYLFQPVLSKKFLLHSALGDLGEAEILYKEVGRSATVLAVATDRAFEVRSNGLPEARVARRGAVPFFINTTYYLALLPVIARPEAETMMVIGFGGGVSLESVPESILELDVIELEPEIIHANQAISDRRRIDPLEDPRLNLVYNDARGALALTEEKWDIIVSQPSHPWTAGASHLFTREFHELSKEHLNEGGVFVQWMGAEFLDEELFGSLSNTLMASFKYVRLYRPVSTMLTFLASDSPLEVERNVVRTGEPMASNKEWWARVGLHDINEVVAALALEQDGLKALSGDQPICTDDANLLAMRAKPTNAFADKELLTRFLAQQEPLLKPGSALGRELAPYIDHAYVARRMAFSDQLTRGILCSNVLPAESALKARVQGGLKASFMSGDWEGGIQSYQLAFNRDPKDMDSCFLVLRDNLTAVVQGVDGTQMFRRVADTLEGPAKTVYEGWKLFVAGQFEELKALEPILAGAVPRDPWYIAATRLRVAWRLQLATAEGRQRVGQECLQMIDIALVLEPDPYLTIQRADAATAAKRPAYFVESLYMLSLFAGTEASSLPVSVVNDVAKALTGKARLLKSLKGKRAALDERIDHVAEKVRVVLAAHQERRGGQ
ncbi:MAG: spermidine synthase [Candidatus Paceibacteria bacterium]|jgi:spermidine synthase